MVGFSYLAQTRFNASCYRDGAMYELVQLRCNLISIP